MSTPSSLKRKLALRELTIGSWVSIDSVMVAEVLAGAGFEWLVIDQEHTAIDVVCAKMQMIAAQSRGVEVLVRVEALDEPAIKKALDCGAQGVIVPMVKTVADAETAVALSYYPPSGRRGVGLHRAQGYGPGFGDYVARLSEGLVVVAQIEHADAVENIEGIVSVDGIDAVLIGPYDLSASMGFAGDFARPELQEAIERVRRACNRVGKPYGYHSVSSRSADAIRLIEQGARMMAYGVDFLFLLESAKQGLDQIKETFA